MDKKDKVLMAFLFVGFMFSFWHGQYVSEALNESRAKVVHLEGQVFEYKMASRPVLTARGWFGWPIQDVTEITPEILGYATNPCYNTSHGDWDYTCGPTKRSMPISIKRLE